MHINLISDTVTRPGPGMLEAMINASVGDDVFKLDPTVNRLQEKVADMFGHEAALILSFRDHDQSNCHSNTRPGVGRIDL